MVLPNISLESLSANPVFSGVAGAAVLSWLLFQVRAVPARLTAAAKSLFSTELVVRNDDRLFDLLDSWLAAQPYAGRARRLQVTARHDHDRNEDDYLFIPGEGLHWWFRGARPLLVYRDIDDKAAAPEGRQLSARRREKIVLTLAGRDRGAMRAIVEEAVRDSRRPDKTAIYAWLDGFYTRLAFRTKRRPDTLFLRKGVWRRLLDDARTFESRFDWYAERAIPYRRNYLLEGPPGSGKTSIALVLAGALDRPIYVVNPNGVGTDAELLDAFNEAPSNALILIEDIDSCRSALSRDIVIPEALEKTLTANPGSKVTTSGLLNAIDGVGSREGRILVITTNHADLLDPALVRPGRVDVRFHIGWLGLAEAMQMFDLYWPAGDRSRWRCMVEPLLPTTAAAMQELLLDPMHDWERAQVEPEPEGRPEPAPAWRATLTAA